MTIGLWYFAVNPVRAEKNCDTGVVTLKIKDIETGLWRPLTPEEIEAWNAQFKHDDQTQRDH